MIVLNDGSVVRVDDVDMEWAEQWRWTRTGKTDRKPGYAARGIRVGGPRRLFYMHREIGVRAGLLQGYDDPLLIDHRDRDTSNNRRSNLRAVTYGGNNRNRIVTAVSGFGGVYLDKRRGTWSAEINHAEGRVRKSGFPTAVAANTWRLSMLEGY